MDWGKICRCFFAQYCQGVHLSAGISVSSRNWNLEHTAFTKIKVSEALLTLLTYQCVIRPLIFKCLWACYLDCQGPVLMTSEYHFRVVFTGKGWEATASRKELAWASGELGCSSPCFDAHLLRHLRQVISSYQASVVSLQCRKIGLDNLQGPSSTDVPWGPEAFFLPGAEVSILIKVTGCFSRVQNFF